MHYKSSSTNKLKISAQHSSTNASLAVIFLLIQANGTYAAAAAVQLLDFLLSFISSLSSSSNPLASQLFAWL